MVLYNYPIKKKTAKITANFTARYGARQIKTLKRHLPVFSEQFWPNNADRSRKFLFLYAIWRTINGPQAAAGLVDWSRVEWSGCEWWPSGARVSCTIAAAVQRMACFPYWTFVNRTTVDATWCHKIKSSEPWIFSLTFFSFIFFFHLTVCACWLCWFGRMKISLIFYSYES